MSEAWDEFLSDYSGPLIVLAAGLAVIFTFVILGGSQPPSITSTAQRGDVWAVQTQVAAERQDIHDLQTQVYRGSK